MQPLLLVSGAVAGGLLGAAAMRLLYRRRLSRVAARLAVAMPVELAAEPATPPELARLLRAFDARLQSLREERDEAGSQHRRLAAEVVELMQQAAGAARAKERFLEASGHDLRQPLQAMELALAQLRRDAAPAQEADIGHLHEGLRGMAEILDGLLLLSQLDADAVHAQASSCDLPQLFAEVLAPHRDAAARAGVALHARAGGLAVTTDPGMLGALLGRLLANAIAAAPSGTVLLAARARGDRVRIEVRDNGVGLAPVHQARVFDEFFQVGNPERDRRKGLGLGLSVASRLASLLGTRIELRSRLHAGSCFWIELPRAQAHRRRPRALLLHDDRAERDAVAGLLQAWGYAVDDGDGKGDGGSDAAPADVVVCALDDGGDAAWLELDRVRARHPRATCVVLSRAPSGDLLARTGARGAHLLLRPPAPAKLRALLAGTRTAMP